LVAAINDEALLASVLVDRLHQLDGDRVVHATRAAGVTVFSDLLPRRA